MMEKVIKADEIDKLKEIPVVFVLGTGRSGTTLLQSLLDAHPNIVAPPETKFIAILYPRFSSIKKWTESDIIDFVDSLKMDPQFVEYWNINWDLLLKNLMAAREVADFSLICKMVYYQMKRDKGDVKLISDKNPLYILFIDKLRVLYPNGKFIHIVRDPRAVINSTMKTFSMKNYIFNANGWVIQNSIIESDKKNNPSKYFTIKYEKLVEDTEGTLKDLCGFLNLPFNEEMLTHKIPDMSHNRKFEKKYLEKIHKSLTKPVNIESINKWEGELKAEEKIIVEYITGEFANTKYGYNTNVSKRSTGIPVILIIWKMIVFNLWIGFTRFRFSNLSFNLWYSKKFKKGRIGEAY